MIIPGTTDITLGILAGGRGLRLGGADKAWLERDGVAQVGRLAKRFDKRVDAILVSANRNLHRYDELGLSTVRDGLADLGPMGGLHALAASCCTPWLLTLPVDVIDINECLQRTLVAEASLNGAFAVDEDGPQPLVALWRVESLRATISSAIANRDFAVHALQQRLALRQVRFAGVRFGNLNTPEDLAAARIVVSHE